MNVFLYRVATFLFVGLAAAFGVSWASSVHMSLPQPPIMDLYLSVPGLCSCSVLAFVCFFGSFGCYEESKDE